MLPTVPLFPGLPGGPELLIVLLVMVLVLGIPTLLVAAAAFFGIQYVRGDDTREERIEELEREVHRLRGRVEDATVPDDPASGVVNTNVDGGADGGADADADARPPTDDADERKR